MYRSSGGLIPFCGWEKGGAEGGKRIIPTIKEKIKVKISY